MNKNVAKKIIRISTLGLTLSALLLFVPLNAVASVNCSKEGKKAGKAVFDPAGEYHAYFEFQQTDSWVFRNSWIEPTLGLNGTDFTKNQSFNKILASQEGAPEFLEGTITDAVIDGNGTYTVKVENMDTSYLDSDAAKVSMLGVSTDIPSAAIDDGSITISNVSWAIDGIDKGTVEPYINADTKEWGLFQFEIINTYQNDGYVNPSMMLPDKGEISISFTVSGMSQDSQLATASDTSSTSQTDVDTTSTANGTKDTATKNFSTTTVIILMVLLVVVVGAVVIIKKRKKN